MVLMLGLILAAIISFATAFIACNIVTPFIMHRMAARGIVGTDMNKLGKPKVPEMGGIGVWVGFSAGVMAAIFLFSYFGLSTFDLALLLAGLATINMIGFLGVIDDLVGWKNGIRQWQHALIPLFAALPLMAIKISNAPIKLPIIGLVPETYFIPIIGTVSFGIIYSLVLVPIGVTGASNAANMLAGLNGLEAGLGALIIGTLLALSLVFGHTEAAIIAVAMLGAILAFARYNWFPAKIFGGDSLTLMIGAAIATIAIVGDMEKIGIILMALYFVELWLKWKSRMQAESFGIPQHDGTLKAPKETRSISHIVMTLGKFSEKRVVEVILAAQAAICLAIFLLSYFKLIW
jgi:UDP-N-acetylglucosamine--dolichyl-phosphate N-acetylglucosaminephosphotransferase